MKTKTLIGILSVLLVLLIAGLVVQKRSARRSPRDALGKPLLPGLALDRVAAVLVKGPEGSVTLKKGPSGWVVEERYGYPADFGKLAALARSLRDAQVGRRFEASEETLERLSLGDPAAVAHGREARATSIALKDEKGRTLASVLLGTRRSGGPGGRPGGGRYVRVQGKGEVFLVDQEFPGLSAAPAQWLKKEVIRVPAEEVQGITCLSQGGQAVIYRVQRPGKGKDLEVMGLKAGERAAKPALKRLSGALSSLRLKDVRKASIALESKLFPGAPVLAFRLFDGRIVRVWRGRQGEGDSTAGAWVRLSVDFEAPPKTDTGKEGGKKPSEKTAEERALEARQEKERLAPWVFHVGKWQADALFTQKADLLEKQPAPPTKRSQPPEGKAPEGVPQAKTQRSGS